MKNCSPASSQREEAKENPALQMSRFQEHFPLALSDQDFPFIRKFMDKISVEKGNCDKNQPKQSSEEETCEARNFLGQEIYFLKKCGKDLFCRNDIANE